MNLMHFSSACIRSSLRFASIIPKERVHHSSPLRGTFLNELSRRSMSSSPTYTAEYLADKLKASLEAEHVHIEDLSNCGCGMKFDAILVSPKFEGKPVLQRQRLVNQILVEEMKYIHAFTMRTLTPNQWKERLTNKE